MTHLMPTTPEAIKAHTALLRGHMCTEECAEECEAGFHEEIPEECE